MQTFPISEESEDVVHNPGVKLIIALQFDLFLSTWPYTSLSGALPFWPWNHEPEYWTNFDEVFVNLDVDGNELLVRYAVAWMTGHTVEVCPSCARALPLWSRFRLGKTCSMHFGGLTLRGLEDSVVRLHGAIVFTAALNPLLCSVLVLVDSHSVLASVASFPIQSLARGLRRMPYLNL